MATNKAIPLQVVGLSHSTPDALTITLQPLAESEADFNYQAGQFLTVEVDINGHQERRCYSLNSSPALDSQLEITVKRLPGGLVSNYLHDQLTVESTLRALAPSGQFTPDISEDNHRSYYLFAAGSGITPVLSITRTILSVEPWSYIYLLYGSRDEENIILREKLNETIELAPDRIAVEHTLSQPLSEKWSALWKSLKPWEGDTGRIDDVKIRDFIQRHPPKAQQARYLICGPGEMIATTQKALLALDVSMEDILVEHFHADNSSQDVPQSVESTLTVGKQQIAVDKGQTLLDALRENQIDAPYSCQSGVCGSCKAQLKNGKVDMPQHMALTDSELQEGKILLCQSYAKSDEIKVEL